MKSNTFNDQYKHVPFLAMLYMAFGIFPLFFAEKFIFTPIGAISLSPFLWPFWFLLGSVIVDVYGYKMSIKFFWSFIVTGLIMALIFNYLISFKSPGVTPATDDYMHVFGHLLRDTVVDFIVLILAWRINAFLLAQLKTLLQGKYFLLRIIGATIIGQTLFCWLLMPTWIFFYHIPTFAEAFHLNYWCYLISITMTIVFAPLCVLATDFLKRSEEADVYDEVSKFVTVLKLI